MKLNCMKWCRLWLVSQGWRMEKTTATTATTATNQGLLLRQQQQLAGKSNPQCAPQSREYCDCNDDDIIDNQEDAQKFPSHSSLLLASSNMKKLLRHCLLNGSYILQHPSSSLEILSLLRLQIPIPSVASLWLRTILSIFSLDSTSNYTSAPPQ